MIIFAFITMFLYYVQLDVALLLRKPVVVVDDLGNLTGLLGALNRLVAYITIWLLFMYVSGLEMYWMMWLIGQIQIQIVGDNIAGHTGK